MAVRSQIVTIDLSLQKWFECGTHLRKGRFVVTGTYLSINIINDSVGKETSFEFFSNTGAFVTREPFGRYVRSYLWPKYNVLTNEAQHILDNAWRWLRGRSIWLS